MQCTCMALTFLCFSSKPQSLLDFYQPEVIDNILRHGNELYSMHIAELFSGIPRYLLANELPKTVRITNTQFVAKQSSVFTGLINTRQSDADSLTFSVADGLRRCFEQSPYCLMTIGKGGNSGYTTAVVKVSDERYLSFDSHARDAKGLQSASGKAVVMQASSVLGFVQHVHDLSKSIFADTLIPFELLVVDVSCTREFDEAKDAAIAGDVPTDISSNTLVAASAGNQYLHQRQLVGARSDVSSENRARHADNVFSVFVPVNTTGRRLLRCSVCFELQEIARLFANKKSSCNLFVLSQAQHPERNY